MKTPSRRTKKVANELQFEISRLIIEKISDPALQGMTITDLELSSDLKHARVFYTTPQNEKEIQKGFKRAMPFIRRKISEDLSLRYVPEIVFEKDTHLDKLDSLFKALQNN
jgi:ribosome-binding factor A